MGELVEVFITKQDNGAFGLTFDVVDDGTNRQVNVYVVTRVSPTIISDQIILPGDLLISINNRRNHLDTYCRSPEAKLLPHWNVVLQRNPAQLGQTAPRGTPTAVDPPAFITTDKHPYDLAQQHSFDLGGSVLYTSPPEVLENALSETTISQHSASTQSTPQGNPVSHLQPAAPPHMSELQQGPAPPPQHVNQTQNWINQHRTMSLEHSITRNGYQTPSNSSVSGLSSYQFSDIHPSSTPNFQSRADLHHSNQSQYNNQQLIVRPMVQGPHPNPVMAADAPHSQHSISQPVLGNQQYYSPSHSTPQRPRGPSVGSNSRYDIQHNPHNRFISYRHPNSSPAVEYSPRHYSQPLPTTERQRPAGASENESDVYVGDSFSCSVMSFGSTESSRDRFYHAELAQVALKRPGTVRWSPQLPIRYDVPDLILWRGVKLKKKILNDDKRVQWIMFETIPHQEFAEFGPQGPLRPGDWLVAINGEQVPFDGATGWFRQRVSDAIQRQQPILFTIQRPEQVGDDTNLQDAMSIDTELPPMRQRRPTATSTTSAQSVTEPGKNLTINPELQEKGIGLFEGARKSLQLLPIEKLGRFRLVFHELCGRNSKNSGCTALQQQLIPRHAVIIPDEARRGLTSIEEYHTHLTLLENGGDFQSPVSCINHKENCDFEIQELLERMVQKINCRREDAELLLSSSSQLDPSMKSGPISIQDLQKVSFSQDRLRGDKTCPQMHLEVLSLPELDSKTKTWYSPVLYCKHSVNIIVVDPTELTDYSSPNSLQGQLSILLNEISCYSRDLVNDRNYHQPMGRVLLVLTTTSSNGFAAADPTSLKKLIHSLFPNHKNMFIKSNNFPFIVYDGKSDDANEIRQALFSELRVLSEKDIKGSNKYPRAAIMAAQELHKLSHEEIIDRKKIETFLEILESQIKSEDDDSRKTLIEGTLSYLHNTGQAYIPAYSLSEYIGKSEPGFKHSVVLHPFRLVSYYDRLINPHDDTETLLRKGEISAEELKRILHRLSPATDSEKLIDLFKEMHIVIPNFFRKDSKTLSMPMLQQGESPKVDHDTPQLVLSYRDNQCFLLLSALLQMFAGRARSSHLNLSCSQGTFDIFGFSVTIRPATWTNWGRLKPQVSLEHLPPMSESQKHMCIYARNSENSTTTNELTAQLQSMVDDFHQLLHLKPIIGNPCPIPDKCTNTNKPYHVLSFNEQSCSGQNLVHMPDLVSYNPSKLGAFPEQVRLSKKEEIMSIQAFNLPSEILDVLAEYSTLERNWVGIAKKEQFSQPEIDKIMSSEGNSKSYTLLKELSVRGGYSIRDLLGQLASLEHVDLTVRIGKWIDEQLKKP